MTLLETDEEYILFTRIKRGDDLVEVGSFTAGNDRLAAVYAQHIYNEEDWVEMKLVRRKDIMVVRMPKPLIRVKGGKS